MDLWAKTRSICSLPARKCAGRIHKGSATHWQTICIQIGAPKLHLRIFHNTERPVLIQCFYSGIRRCVTKVSAIFQVILASVIGTHKGLAADIRSGKGVSSADGRMNPYRSDGQPGVVSELVVG
jgi:hypothetical protein